MKRYSLALAIAFVLLQACITVRPVEFRKVENFSVTSNNNAPLLNFSLVFYNPNTFGCNVEEIHSEGAFNGQQVFNAGNLSRIRVKRKSVFSVPVTARISKMDFSQVLGAGLNLLLNDEAVPMKVNGKIKMKKCFFTKTVPFNYNQPLDKALLKKLF